MEKIFALLCLWMALELGGRLGRRGFPRDEAALQWSQGLALLLVMWANFPWSRGAFAEGRGI